MQNELNKILEDNGIDPIHENKNFNPNPNPILEDFFETLGRCLKPIEETYNIKPKGWRKDQINKQKRDGKKK